MQDGCKCPYHNNLEGPVVEAKVKLKDERANGGNNAKYLECNAKMYLNPEIIERREDGHFRVPGIDAVHPQIVPSD